MASTSLPQAEILTVRELLALPVRIPLYQRPYKWTTKNVLQLFADLIPHRGRSTYRLGTVVFHEHGDGTLNIVDGQQRMVSLLLLLQALKTTCGDVAQEIDASTMDRLGAFSFENRISQANIYHNYHALCAVAGRDITREDVHFLLYSCEVVSFTLDDISEAFQFFDSQNARGKDLVPHDLLKAYHLRELPGTADGAEKKHIVEHWEKSESAELHELFARYLYRIRKWIRGESGLFFTKKEVDTFKGLRLSEHAGELYPYARMWHALRSAHCQPFPFQLDQPIINGACFFEMVNHYQNMQRDLPCPSCCRIEMSDKKSVCKIFPSSGCPQEQAGDTESACAIFRTLETYGCRFRTGDRHVHALFTCLLLGYRDRFGPAELPRAIVHCFIWAYCLRLQSARVSMVSVDNYVLKHRLFATLHAALSPQAFFAHRPEKFSRAAVKTDEGKVREIIDIFVETGFLQEKENGGTA